MWYDERKAGCRRPRTQDPGRMGHTYNAWSEYWLASGAERIRGREPNSTAVRNPVSWKLSVRGREIGRHEFEDEETISSGQPWSTVSWVGPLNGGQHRRGFDTPITA